MSRKAKENLKRAIQWMNDYFLGKRMGWCQASIDITGFTAFECKVLQTLRRMPYGTKQSYSELANQAGFPRAARAIGSVMRKNRLPIFIPCHRIIHSNGDLGGFSKGSTWKRRLLRLESMSHAKK